ncbi:MAG: hypothetical protein ACRDZO_04460 [Egibacteraceae bacterium]
MPDELPIIDPDALSQFLDRLEDGDFRRSFLTEPTATCENEELTPGLPEEFIQAMAELTPEELELVARIARLIKGFRFPPIPFIL